jgi:hypothetical protein
MENKDMPAFAFGAREWSNDLKEMIDSPYYGLTKREYIAIMAMQGLMAVNEKGEFASAEICVKEAAKLAVIAADALLNELSTPQP